MDAGWGRVNVLAGYEATLGHEFKRYDPHLGSYTLSAAAEFPLGRALVGAR